ncbi:MAG: flagellar filament capping protein FliD [Turicibacter sp.]|nr:flagellar filament capping protein FliD [Turicibacter sp.]
MGTFSNQMRFTGMSGLDVNDMVSQLMRAHAIRLDRMRQNRDIIVWQRDMLRGVGGDMRDFRDQFLSFTTNQQSNIRAPSNFTGVNTTIVDRDGNALRGITVGGGSPGVTDIRVESTATGDRFRSTHNLSRSIRGSNNFDANLLAGLGGFSMQVNLNGRTETIEIEASAIVGITNAAFVNLFNIQLQETFGNDVGGPPNPNVANLGADNRQHIWATIEGGVLVINTRENNIVGIGPGQTDTYAGHRLETMGFELRTRPDGTTIFPTTAINPAEKSMPEFMQNSDGAFNFEINGVVFEFDGETFTVDGDTVMEVVDPHNLTLQQVLNAINTSSAGVSTSFSFTSGRFTMESDSIGAVNGSIDFNITSEFFSLLAFSRTPHLDSNNNPILDDDGEPIPMDPNVTRLASDAVVIVDGNRIVRASNTFTIDDLMITLDPAMLQNEILLNGAIDATVTMERDTEHTMNVIREFVAGYNEFIQGLRDLVETRRPRQTGGGFYMPLTEEQRNGMSEREILLWEERAMTGLLHRDVTLRSLMNNIRQVMFQDVNLDEGGTINLLNIGIRTHSDLNLFGHLEINEDMLQAAVNDNIDAVNQLFTRMSEIPAVGAGADRAGRLADSGLGARLNDLIHWELTTDGGLHDRVGATTGDSPPNDLNRMGARITEEDRRIDDLLVWLQRREDRYFQMFGRLEAAMVQANSQMMFLEQMIWSGQ